MAQAGDTYLFDIQRIPLVSASESDALRKKLDQDGHLVGAVTREIDVIGNPKVASLADELFSALEQPEVDTPQKKLRQYITEAQGASDAFINAAQQDVAKIPG